MPESLVAELAESPVPPLLVDTHTHLHFDAYRGQVDAVLRRAHEAGVRGLLTVGVNTADSLRAVELAGTYDGMWAAVGIHPHDADEAEQGLGYLGELAARRKVVAIGECGVDLYKSQTSLEQQQAALRGQIELALRRELPLIFHVREAFTEFWELLEEYRGAGLRGVVHSFSGGPAEVERAVAVGLHLALNGIITFTKVEEQLAAAREIPADRLVLETDCPFLSPAQYRGQTNEPARVVDIAAVVAQLRGVSPEALAAGTSANAARLFGIEAR